MAELTAAIRNGGIVTLLMVLAAWQQPAAGAEDSAGELLPDPTVPLSRGTLGDEGAVSTGSLTLNSILIREEERLAVINGRQVKAGDRLGNLRILSVETDHVRIEINGQERVLELYSTSVRQPRQSEG